MRHQGLGGILQNLGALRWGENLAKNLNSSGSSGKIHWKMLVDTSDGQAETVPADPLPSEDEPEEDRRRRLEAILFLAKEPLSSRKLAQLTGLADATEARTLTRRLNEFYDSEGRAMRVEEVAGGFRLMTRPQFAKWLRRLEHVPAEERLTQPTLETLALVAYRQPILRASMEAIRGVGCGEVLRQLMQRDLVRICGRSEELGRPYLYGTTRRFLQLFGLQSIERLPRAEWVRQTNLIPEHHSTEKQVSVSDVSPQVLNVGSETKESNVKIMVAAYGLNETLDELLDPRLSRQLENVPLVASDEDDFEDEEFEDEEDEDDDFDDDEDFDDEEEDEDDEEFDDEEEEFEDEDSEEESEDDEWEEVEEEEGDEEEEDEDDDEWDDDDDDWDDDEEDEEEEEEEWD